MPLSTDAALIPLLSIARRVGDAAGPRPAVGDLEWKADPYGFARLPALVGTYSGSRCSGRVRRTIAFRQRVSPRRRGSST